jgi:hypothetical protein
MLMVILQLVVVAELDVVCIAVFEPEADAPLVVDRDGVLPRAIAFESVKPIAGRNLEVRDLVRDMDSFKLAQGAARDVGGHLGGLPSAEELFSPPISEGLDHGGM